MYLRSFGRRYNLFWIRISTEQNFQKNYLNPLDLGNNRVPAIWESKQNF